MESDEEGVAFGALLDASVGRAGLAQDRSLTLAQLFDKGDHDEMLGKLKVVSMLESLPGVGKVRARRLMEELDISESRRLRGLGVNQRERLLDRFA